MRKMAHEQTEDARSSRACCAACVATVLQGGERGQGGGAGSSAVGRHAHTPRVRGETVSWELPQLSWVTSRSLTHDTMYYVSCLFCLVSARVDCEFLLRPSNHAATHDYHNTSMHPGVRSTTSSKRLAKPLVPSVNDRCGWSLAPTRLQGARLRGHAQPLLSPAAAYCACPPRARRLRALRARAHCSG